MQANKSSDQRIVLDGIDATIEILIDRFGIPHVYAQSEGDAFFAQGFNAARDRLWQLDLWRRRGLGRLSAAFGQAFVDRDRAARLLLYRGDMAAEWASYGEQAKAWTTRFTAGINAYLSLLEAEPERLPLEFVATGVRPEAWEPEDVVRCRGHARVRNLDTEISRANVAAAHGLDAASLVKGLDPPWRLSWPEGLPRESIPEAVLRTYRLATTLVDLSNAELDGEANVASELDGSNNWALRPDRSHTGRALLATDPHRLQELPSLRYTVHLNAPGLNVIGAGEPAVPGVSLGHNEHIAFGLTIFPTDQEDLYVYELDPDDPTRYRYGDGWAAMESVTETIEVRGQPSRDVQLQFTVHGPVLHVDADARRAYAIRTVWTEPGTAAYLASLRYQQAQNWDDFVRAQDGWGAPSVNHVYADVEGNVGWITAGKLPIRPGWDGLLPVPGDGRYEWQGFMDSTEHPRDYNPACGWVGSANQMNLPADFDHARHKTGFEFAAGGRYQRLSEVLESKPQHDLADMAALQADVQCQAAKRLIPRLGQLTGLTGDAARAAELLSAWDLELSVDSQAAPLFEIWFRRYLVPRTLDEVGSTAVRQMIEVHDTDLALAHLTSSRKGQSPAGSALDQAAVDDLLVAALTDAWTDTVALLGPDPAVWAWGELHQATLRHPLGPMLGPAIAQRLDIGPLPKSGSALTVNNNGYAPADFRVIHGVSWRMLADVGNWDACLTINSPGQSGDPASPHYADHFPLWAREAYVPLLFSREAIEAEVERRIILEPAT